jgi:hypothetical protein
MTFSRRRLYQACWFRLSRVGWFSEEHTILIASTPEYHDDDNDQGNLREYYLLHGENGHLWMQMIGNPILTQPDGSPKAMPLNRNKGFVTEWGKCV